MIKFIFLFCLVWVKLHAIIYLLCVLKVAFVAGVADTKGFGWATAKQLANAGATVIVGTWPPMLKKFQEALDKGFGDEATLLDGSTLHIQKVTAP